MAQPPNFDPLSRFASLSLAQATPHQQLADFEQLCQSLYGNASASSPQERQQADTLLQRMVSSPESVEKLRFFLETSSVDEAKFLAASGLKQILTEHSDSVKLAEKLSIKLYLLSYLRLKGPDCQQHVLKMMITLLCRATKQLWIEQPEVHGIVDEVSQMFNESQVHLLIGLQTLLDLIVEIGYNHGARSLALQQLINIRFRDTGLLKILEKVSELFGSLVHQILQSGAGFETSPALLCQALHQASQILERSLAFNYTFTHMNEALDEPTCTSVPTAWVPLIVISHKFIVDLFFALRQAFPARNCETKVTICKTLSYLANLRHSTFEDQAQRINYVGLLVASLIELMQEAQSQALSSFLEVEVFKEFVQILIKLHSNFSSRDIELAGTSLLDRYLQLLCHFTHQSFKLGAESPAAMPHASKLLAPWHRLVFEMQTFRMTAEDVVAGYVSGLITAYIDLNLALAEKLSAGGSPPEEDENFEERQRTTKHDDYDHFSKLMKFKVQESMEYLLQKLDGLIKLWEAQLNLNPSPLCDQLERKITFLVQLLNSFFSYGYPSAVVRQPGYTALTRRDPIDLEMGDESAAVTPAAAAASTTKWVDFQLTQRVIYLCKVSTQLMQAGRPFCSALKHQLLQFTLIFKNHVLTDSRLVTLGTTLREDLHSGDSSPVMTFDAIYETTQQAYGSLAKLMGQQSMEEVLQIFAQAWVIVLMSPQAQVNPQEHQHLVDFTLEILGCYLNNTVACRQISQIDVVKQLAQSHISQFRILQDPHQQKQLGQFFKVLAGIWLTDNFVADFHNYLDQLREIIQQIFALDTEQMRTTPGVQAEFIKLFYILRGIMRALITQKQFNRFFDWFYPHFLSAIVEGALNAFHEDDRLVHVCLKMLIELVHNRNQRLRFDTWNLNGLVVFKESAKYIAKLLQVWDSLRSKKASAGQNSDSYVGKFKFVREFSQWFLNVTSGHYINFAISAYYQDNTYIEISSLIMNMYASLDLAELRSYSKVRSAVFNSLWSFFQHHTELIVLKLDFALINALLKMLSQGLREDNFEVQSDSCNCINTFCDFVFSQLMLKPTERTGLLHQRAQSYVAESKAFLVTVLQETFSSMIFHGNRSMWLYQQVVHAQLCLCLSFTSTQGVEQQNGLVNSIRIGVVELHENNEERRALIMKQIEQLVAEANTPVGSGRALDSKSRDNFSCIFTKFKKVIYELFN